MKNNRALFIALSLCTINVFGMDRRNKKENQILNSRLQKRQSRPKNNYVNKHTYKAVITSPDASSATVSKETVKLVVKSYGTPPVSVAKYTHKMVVKSFNAPSVVAPQEDFKTMPQALVFIPYPLSVTPEKTTFGTPETSKMLLAHSNALFRAQGGRLVEQENNLRHSVNEKILVNHLFQTLNMFSHEK